MKPVFSHAQCLPAFLGRDCDNLERDLIEICFVHGKSAEFGLGLPRGTC